MPATLTLVSDNSPSRAPKKSSNSSWAGAEWVPPPRRGPRSRGLVRTARLISRKVRHRWISLTDNDRGAVTAEYAIVIMAAVIRLRGII